MGEVQVEAILLGRRAEIRMAACSAKTVHICDLVCNAEWLYDNSLWSEQNRLGARHNIVIGFWSIQLFVILIQPKIKYNIKKKPMEAMCKLYPCKSTMNNIQDQVTWLKELKCLIWQ